jgi:two-component system cell cycle sensor histidine kinase/response regulator CckA
MSDSTDHRPSVNERFLDSIVENIPNMIFVKEAAELRFVRFNRAGEALLGHAREDLIGRNDYDFFPEEQADFFTEKDRQVLAGGKLVDIPEEPIDTAHGKRWLHTMKIPVLGADGEPEYLLGISEDITARKEAQEALERRSEELAEANRDLEQARSRLQTREEQLSFLLEHLPGAYWTVDAEARLTSLTGRRSTAIAPSVTLGQPIAELFDEGVVEAHQAAALGEEQAFELHRGDRIFEVRIEPLGAGRGVAGLALDVTEHRRLEAERLQVRLQKAQKLEVLGVLAGGIAHDFNNLLVSMLGHASLAMMRLPPDSPAMESLRQVEASAERAADLTRQLLAYSGRGRFVVEPLVLNDAIQEIVALLRVSIAKGIELRLDFQGDLPAVEADLAQIRQLVMNLITNASDAIGDKGGVVRLTTRLVETDHSYFDEHWLQQDLPQGLYVALEVSDTGMGMKAETQTRMFDPFFTTKPRGHGLGLAAALGIVRGHKGTIRVYSELGRGTTIKILFPVADPEAARQHRATIAEQGEPERGVVLVVDDEASVRRLAVEALNYAGLDTLEAADGLEALALFEDPELHVDAVVLDMTMPNLNGEETFRRLRQLRPSLPVLLSSGYNEQEATSRFTGKGLAGFLQKPYRAQDLIEHVKRALASEPPEPGSAR